MKTDRKLSRRSFMGRVVGGTVAGGAFVALAGQAEALQVSDSDSGPNSDPAGRGRTGVTDSDGGPNADRPNHGRGGPRSQRPCTDSDTGPNSDPASRGRGNGRSDSDPTDRAGCGRR
jgi:hypothetical protein